jgi:outer membrane immunogenic protein
MNSFKLALLGATFLAAAGAVSGANAADVYARGGSLKDSGPVDYMPAITWTGFYLGGNLGATFDSGISNSDDDTSFLGGVHAGYNWQRNDHLVLGIEGDVDFADEINYLASVRGRIGYAAGSTLFYATGGVAFLNVDDFFGDSETFTGYVVGGGIEHKLRENVSLGLEALYYNFEDDSGVDDADTVAVRARMTYHFNDSRGEALK